MKHATHAGLAIKIATFYFIVAATCHTIQAQSEVRFRTVHGTLAVVAVMANQQGPFDFILDTGADTTIVDPCLASKLSLVSLSRAQQTTLAGVQSLTVSSLATLAAGPAHVENLPVLVQDLNELRKMDSHIQGIAGQDFLSHFNYLLDYQRHSIRFEAAREIRDAVEGDPVPLERGGNRMIVASEAQSVNRAKLRLLLDSGANTLVLLPAASNALTLSVQEGGIEATSSGNVGLRMGRIHTLIVGSQQLHEIAVALTATAPAEQIGDGLLPTTLFRSLYVNNRDGFIVLNPRDKRN
jgi:predicted aspartyl protease